jgi:hypothetical protein
VSANALRSKASSIMYAFHSWSSYPQVAKPLQISIGIDQLLVGSMPRVVTAVNSEMKAVKLPNCLNILDPPSARFRAEQLICRCLGFAERSVHIPPMVYTQRGRDPADRHHNYCCNEPRLLLPR